MNRVQKRVFAEVRILLLQEPENWTYGKHTATYGDNIEIWVSNRYYGTTIRWGSIKIGGDGPSLLWWLFPWEWWRKEIVDAVEDAQYRAEFGEAGEA